MDDWEKFSIREWDSDVFTPFVSLERIKRNAG
jgi:hypothetical protein